MMKIKIQVPATTANCGAGFDTFGIACTLYNYFTLEEISGTENLVEILGEGSTILGNDDNNYVLVAIKKIFSEAKKTMPYFKLIMENNIPLARGLGSSSSAIVAGLIAGNHFLGNIFSKEDILNFANDLEGHPDNVAPAIYGGITISYLQDNSGAGKVNLNIPKDLQLIAVVPEFSLATKLAREALPVAVPYEDVIFNLGRVSLLTASFEQNNLELLRVALDDKIHQPYRSHLIPSMSEVFKIALEKGAYGTVISGAGSTLMAFANKTIDYHAIGMAMVNTFAKYDVPSKYHVLDVDHIGAKILTV